MRLLILGLSLVVTAIALLMPAWAAWILGGMVHAGKFLEALAAHYIVEKGSDSPRKSDQRHRI
jgi:hypothetical protein